MALTPKEVEHIAALAKLTLTEEEIACFGEQLSSILDYMNRLQELDTDSILPTTTILPLNNVLRDDVADPSMPPETLLENTQAQEESMFRVDLVVE